MRFPFFASFIVFCIWLSYEIRKSKKEQQRTSDAFWENEAKADSTRRKSLDGLDYITIPFDTLPLSVMEENDDVKECLETLHTLSEGPIVNFTGISNTDLKLQYGAPNIDLLTLYDQRYTVLVRTLQKLAELYYQNGHVQEAEAILSFAVSTRTDVRATYKLLTQIYEACETPDKIEALIPIAESINSPMASHIVDYLKEHLSLARITE